MCGAFTKSTQADGRSIGEAHNAGALRHAGEAESDREDGQEPALLLDVDARFLREELAVDRAENGRVEAKRHVCCHRSLLLLVARRRRLIRDVMGRGALCESAALGGYAT